MNLATHYKQRHKRRAVPPPEVVRVAPVPSTAAARRPVVGEAIMRLSGDEDEGEEEDQEQDNSRAEAEAQVDQRDVGKEGVVVTDEELPTVVTDGDAEAVEAVSAADLARFEVCCWRWRHGTDHHTTNPCCTVERSVGTRPSRDLCASSWTSTSSSGLGQRSNDGSAHNKYSKTTHLTPSPRHCLAVATCGRAVKQDKALPATRKMPGPGPGDSRQPSASAFGEGTVASMGADLTIALHLLPREGNATAEAELKRTITKDDFLQMEASWPTRHKRPANKH